MRKKSPQQNARPRTGQIANPVRSAAVVHLPNAPVYRMPDGTEWRGADPRSLTKDDAATIRRDVGDFHVKYFLITDPADLAEYAFVRAKIVQGLYVCHFWQPHFEYDGRIAHYMEWSVPFSNAAKTPGDLAFEVFSGTRLKPLYQNPDAPWTNGPLVPTPNA